MASESSSEEPIRVALADPPYLGQAKKHYGSHPDFAGEVDHKELIERLVDEFPDGWALCCSSPSLRTLLALCPEDVRISAWVKPFVIFKKGSRVSYAWEPVIWRGGRKKTTSTDFISDYVSVPIVLKNNDMRSDGAATKGSKPEMFCFWVFAMLGLQEGDTLVDLFPGSGAVTRAFDQWSRQSRLPIVHPAMLGSDQKAAKRQEELF